MRKTRIIRDANGEEWEARPTGLPQADGTEIPAIAFRGKSSSEEYRVASVNPLKLLSDANLLLLLARARRST